MSSQPDYFAQSAYDSGEHPIDHAVQRLQILLDVVNSVTEGRRTNPAAFPVHTLGTDPLTTARRAVGLMLECGWTPPGVLR